MIKQVAILMLVIVFSGCARTEFEDVGQLLKFINDAEHGVAQSKTVNGFEIQVKYLPSDYLAYQDLKSRFPVLQSTKDSMKANYGQSRTFLLSIGPDLKSGEDFDILKGTVNNYEEYAQKVMKLNFGISSLTYIKTADATYYPVLSTMENVYGLDQKRNIILVFANDENRLDLLTAEELELTFEDEIFNTGINHFVFTKDNIDNIPNFKF